MKLKDKMLIMVIAGAVMCTVADSGVSIADAMGTYTEESEGTASTAVTYSESEVSTYTVLIPATLALEKDKSVQEKLEIRDCSIAADSRLSVSIVDGLDENGRVRLMMLKDGEASPNAAAVYSEVCDVSGKVCSNKMILLEADSNTSNESTSITFNPPVGEDSNDGVIVPGDYQGIITFGIDVSQVEQNPGEV